MAKLPPELPRERRTVYNMLTATADFLGSAAALHQPQGEGVYKSWTWIEYREAVEEIAAGLRSLSIGMGDICAIASETRAEFYLADVGIMTNGSISAAVYTSLPAADQVKTLKAAQPKAIFVESPKMLKTLQDAGMSEIPAKRILFTGRDENAITLDELRQLGAEALIDDPRLLDRIREGVTPESPAILYLTSGATGEPKMGLVAHNAILANCKMGTEVLPLSPSDSTLIFLPSAHITQRLALELFLIRLGLVAWFSESLSKMPGELRSIRPTLFIAPPRVWERMYASITTEIRKKPAAVRKLFYMGLGVGNAVSQARQQGRTPAPWQLASLKFFDKVVFSKIRERLGGRLRLPCSGSAPLGKSLAEFYASIGLPLVEAYGLTEGGVVAVNPVNRPRYGSIGKPLPGCELKLAEDGELLIRGETLFMGYYKDPGATAAVLRDGWLHTGDVAEIDADGYIWITGRKKELIVSSNGKKIYPARIEALFKMHPIIDQILLIGDRLPYMTALVSINEQAAENVAGVGTASHGLEELSRDEAVNTEVKKIVKKVNAQLPPFEQVRRFKIISRDFSIEHGELTPTLKLRRSKAIESFRQEISELYVGREEF
ncbi:MAG: long-chain fatty acid--CoA ligase [Bryobacteraceae bacterium]|nr:long-chain fatty acid--CoA ligase [Bryobacteraceae bacterium]